MVTTTQAGTYTAAYRFDDDEEGDTDGVQGLVTDAKSATDKTFVLSPSEHVPTYGAHGALQSDSCWQYHWNGRGRLKGMTTLANAASKGVPNQRLSFFYDQQGRRILKKVETLDDEGEVERTVSHRFVYDGFLPLAEFIDDSQAGETSRFYTWGLDIQESFHASGEVGALLAVHTSEGQSYVPIYDGNGNVIALADGNTGQEVATWTYGPFGELLESTGRTELCPFGFATHYTDSESGLVYFGYRYYSPETGRWLSREPLGEFESWNLYAYCHNDPVNKFDVLGLSEEQYAHLFADAWARALTRGANVDKGDMGEILLERILKSSNRVIIKGPVLNPGQHGSDVVTFDLTERKLEFWDNKVLFDDYLRTKSVNNLIVNRSDSIKQARALFDNLELDDSLRKEILREFSRVASNPKKASWLVANASDPEFPSSVTKISKTLVKRGVKLIDLADPELLENLGISNRPASSALRKNSALRRIAKGALIVIGGGLTVYFATPEVQAAVESDRVYAEIVKQIGAEPIFEWDSTKRVFEVLAGEELGSEIGAWGTGVLVTGVSGGNFLLDAGSSFIGGIGGSYVGGKIAGFNYDRRNKFTKEQLDEILNRYNRYLDPEPPLPDGRYFLKPSIF